MMETEEKEHFENMLKTAAFMFYATHNQPSPEAMRQTQATYRDYVNKIIMIYPHMTVVEINDIVWDKFQILRAIELENQKLNKKRYIKQGA